MMYGGIRSRMRLRTASTSSNCSGSNNSAGEVAVFGPNSLGDIRNSRILPTDTAIRRSDQTNPGDSRALVPSTSICGATNGGINWDQRALTVI